MGEVAGPQQPHVLCRGYFHRPNYTFHVNQRPRLLIKAGWQLRLLITPVPGQGMEGTEGVWPACCAKLTPPISTRGRQCAGAEVHTGCERVR